MASRPCWSCAGGRTTTANGLPHRASAMPQFAIEHAGSAASVDWKPWMAWTELEGVQQRHRAVELRLRRRRARRLEVHRPELLGRRRVLVVLGHEGCGEQEAGRRQPGQSPKNRVHCGPPLRGRDCDYRANRPMTQ